MDKNNSDYRPYVNDEESERLKKLSNDLNISASKFVNFFIKIGLESFERALPLVKKDIQESIKKLLK